MKLSANTANLLCCSLLLLSTLSCRQTETADVSNKDSTGPQVPDGYSVEVVADSTLVDYPMFATLDETGRLFVFESTGNVYDETEDAIRDPRFRIKLLYDTSGDGRYDKATIYADKVGFPQGGVFYKGSLIASSAPDLLKFTDTDNDGVSDKREVMLSGWTLNVNANSLVGPSMSPDGWLYMNNAIEGFDVTSKEGVKMKGETARTWRVRPDGSGLEWISAGGMNNPVELTYTEAAEPIGTETYFTDPVAGERDALVYWTEGGVYPKPNDNVSRDKLIRTGELMPVVSKYSRVSPAGIGRYRHTALGNDFRDNLFSAQFNTHRVIRHKLIRQGASFKTEDEIFFWNNTNEDFHPTDVLEDADGSLLIVETGGWFIKGCPLSQVSKPELKGSIYRVRKNSAQKANDPYGNAIRWNEQNADKLAAYLEQENPFLADRAQQTLVNGGEKSVEALTNLLKRSTNSHARTKAVFSLYNIQTPGALAAVRGVLNDNDEQVTIAAARVAGIAKDKAAVPALIRLLARGNNPAARQAATALGQIGDTSAVIPLLHAADNITDRFVQHAIIYSLISMNQPAKVRTGLAHASPQVKEAALIALDQMPGSALTAQALTSFLSSGEEKLQQTALWIATHHPEWSAQIISFLRTSMQRDSLTEKEEKLFTDILVSFSEEPRMQQYIAQELTGGASARKIFFLQAMSKARIKKFPGPWVAAVGRQLHPSSTPLVKTKAIELVQLRGIGSLDQLLLQVADDEKNSPALRMQALAASHTKTLQPRHFDFLYSQLISKNEASLRQQAAAALEKSALSEQQLLHIATQYLPAADPFILPRLVPVFAGAHSEEIGKTVSASLINSPALDGFSEETIQKLFEKYPAGVQPSVQQLLSKLKTVKAERLQRLQEFEKDIPNGVLDRGRALFFGKATCSTCHAIGRQGGTFGPDLTSIQRDRSVHDLLEAVVYPGATFVREYETYRIATRSGTHTGLIKTKTPDVIILETAPQSSVRISRGDIISTEVTDVSMMPQGLDKILTRQEMADLMTFLLGQDQDPETDQRILRHTSNDK